MILFLWPDESPCLDTLDPLTDEPMLWHTQSAIRDYSSNPDRKATRLGPLTAPFWILSLRL